MAEHETSDPRGSDHGTSPSSEQQRRDETVERLREELRRRVRESHRTQRSIEIANGFTRGYLSQVLQGHVTLTARHVFGILFALDVPPGRFFRRFFDDRGADASLSEIRERMTRYDAALRQLEKKGLLSPGTGDDS